MKSPLKNIIGKIKSARTTPRTGKLLSATKKSIANAGVKFLEGYKANRGPWVSLNYNSNNGIDRNIKLFTGKNGEINIPTLDKPQRINAPDKATLTGLNRQLKQLIDIATKIGAITKSQQEQTIKQIHDANRIAREQILESKNKFEPVENTGEGIKPDVDIMEEFNHALKSLTDAINDKNREAQDNKLSNKFLDIFMDRAGLGGLKASRSTYKSEPRVKRGINYDEKNNLYRDKKTGRIVAEKDALKNLRTADPSKLRFNTTRMAQAEELAKPGFFGRMLSGATSKITSIFRPAAARVVTGNVAKEALSKVAGPIVKRAIASTAVKSIPLVGAAVGGAFAISRLLEGDVTGAGLDAVSGLGGPMTAIPALIASVSRDVYSSAYGVQPEKDPHFSDRMSQVTSVVTDMVREWLKSKITPAQKVTPNSQSVPGITKPLKAGPLPPPNAIKSSNDNTPVVRPETVTSARGASHPVPTGQAPSGGNRASKPAAASLASLPSATAPFTSNTGIDNTSTSSRLQGEEGSAPTSILPPAPSKLDGGKLMQASIEEPRTSNIIPIGSRAVPQSAPTTTAGAIGTGNVPTPDYPGRFEFARQIYFSAAS